MSLFSGAPSTSDTTTDTHPHHLCPPRLRLIDHIRLTAGVFVYLVLLGSSTRMPALQGQGPGSFYWLLWASSTGKVPDT